MAGKKKKTLANKLAKMSDEERARYLQRKADVEEEAKKRKEQLISTFMKKKIKKEDAFSRLNLAKINQNWHQILRKTKCQEMRQNVEHMKKWMNRMFDYKNRVISKLLDELEEAEEQYSYNFQSHSSRISNIIEEQHKYINKLQEQFDKNLEELVAENNADHTSNKNTLDEDEMWLKTIIYRQTETSKKQQREQYENYMLKISEQEQLDEIKKMRRSRETISNSLWRQIATVIRLHIQQTDVRRMHFAELKTLDFESASEISRNQDTINLMEHEIERLKSHYTTTHNSNEEKIETMKEEVNKLSSRFLKVRQKLKRNMENDKDKLRKASACAKDALDYMKKNLELGEQLMVLMKTCQKFETEREQITKWFPITKLDVCEEELDEEEHYPELKAIEDAVTIEELEDETESFTDSKSRPKTAFTKTPISRTSAKSLDSAEYVTTPESKRLSAIKSIKLALKQYKSEDVVIEEPKKTELEENLQKCFQSLEKLENFWLMYNKVNVDYMEMKEEKKLLLKENKHLRGMMRAILEAAVLNNSIPNTRASTRAPSQLRSAYSAPLRRIIFKT
ncbi:dynein regulatory complex subunit 2 [Aethina tumida]|uniref:dynein regulatory complex subunit 2 n=1 Tax=Aethina tumida TaxID=116153 RepID=UPI0021478F0E|nr:dynein regulatory complex subunit 2 [Aethina tumida]